VHHGKIHKEKSNKMQQCINIFIISYLYDTVPNKVHQLHVQQPSMYEKPEATSAVLGS
jgi:hypothetical protein